LKCVPPGPHVFFYVIDGSRRFTREENEAFACFNPVFGDNSLKYTALVFTHLDVIETDKWDLGELEQKEPFQTIISECGKRTLWVNNEECDDKIVDAKRKVAMTMCRNITSENKQFPFFEAKKKSDEVYIWHAFRKLRNRKVTTEYILLWITCFVFVIALIVSYTYNGSNPCPTTK